MLLGYLLERLPVLAMRSKTSSIWPRIGIDGRISFGRAMGGWRMKSGLVMVYRVKSNARMFRACVPQGKADLAHVPQVRDGKERERVLADRSRPWATPLLVPLDLSWQPAPIDTNGDENDRQDLRAR